MFYKLYSFFDHKERVALLCLWLASILLALIETIGISAIMPFVAISSNFHLLDTNKYYHYVFMISHAQSPRHFIFLLGSLLIVFYFLRLVYNSAYQYFLRIVVGKCRSSLACKLFKNMIYMPYYIFTKENAAYIKHKIIDNVECINDALESAVIVFSDGAIVLLIYVVLLLVKFKLTIALSVFMILNIWFLKTIINKKMKRYGHTRFLRSQKITQIVLEILGNFKFIKFIYSKDSIIREYSNNYSQLSLAYANSQTYANIPRFVLETSGFSVIIAVVMYVVFKHQDSDAVLPIISMYAIAMYKILPSLSKIMANIGKITYALAPVNEAYNDLTTPYHDDGGDAVSFIHSIILKDIMFGYDDGSVVLDRVSVTINKNDKVALIGESGSGKSTLVDLLMGIYTPDAGCMLVDDCIIGLHNIKSWRAKIGYIPQSIYLFDGSVAHNVTFGYSYNYDKLIDCLIKANIYDFLLTKDGVDTIVGDNGIQLSGGQKQRIAIARALYSNPEILVLDEATSALDSETESKIMDEIYALSDNVTLIVIAHRLSTIARCNKVIKIQNANIYEVCQDV